MDLITTPAQANYTPPVTSIVHNVAVSLTDRAPTIPVHIVQYDMTMPIVAVSLSANKNAYTVPAGAAVNFRMAKTDGNYIYNPALGVSADGQTVYIAITQQTAAAHGTCQPIVEIVLNGAVAASGAFTLIIDKNPVPESAIESTSEFLTIQQIAAQVQQAADLLEQQSTNLQNLTDNLEAVQNAAANATAAEQSAAQAAQSAQQALGFRTFFNAISPDANGSLDPSRPMTTAAAQASWTVKSKGDRIQSVQVNGFTFGGKSAGLNKKIPVPASGWSIENGVFYNNGVLESVTSDSAVYSNIGKTLGTTVNLTSDFASMASEFEYVVGFLTLASGVNTGRMYIKAPFTSVSDLQSWLSSGEFWVIYDSTAPDLSFYIPIQAQGHEYRCQCLPITEALGVGDNVQSNVPSGCDIKLVFDGSQNIIYDTRNASAGILSLRFAYAGQFSRWLSAVFPPSTASISQSTYENIRFFRGNIYFRVSESRLEKYGYTSTENAASAFNAYLTDNPLDVWAKSSSYTEESDIPVSLETHASGNVFAHDPVTLVAVPYTEADVSAAQQLAATPSTLPYIDSADVPMMLDAAEPTAAAAPLASTLPVARTYVVSSQDGTTVAVTLKAFQDGGDAATLGGQSLEQLNGTYLTKEQLLTLVYPVGSIYMSANNVSPQTFLGGTWQQIQGQFLLAASGSYPAGSTGGEAQHTLTVDEIPSHQHEIQYMASNEAGSEWAGQAGACTTKTGTTGFVGGGQAHNNMPPYLAVYMWKRTA